MGWLSPRTTFATLVRAGIAFALMAGAAAAQTTHYVQTNCNYDNTVNQNTALDVSPGDTIVVTYIAHTNTDWQNTFIPQNGCGWYTVPNVAEPYVIRDSNPAPFEATTATTGGDSIAVPIQTGQNAVVTYTVANDFSATSYKTYSLGRRWVRQDINGATATILYVRLMPNQAPTVTAPSAVSVVEDAASQLQLSALDFADADNDSLSVTLSVDSGTLSVSPSAPVSYVVNSATSVTLSGLPSAINGFFDDPANLTYTTAQDADGQGVATLTVSASDGTASLASNPSIQIDAQSVPDVLQVVSSAPSGYYRTGAFITFDVQFDSPVFVQGTPLVTLETGLFDVDATYVYASGPNMVTFAYIVQQGDTAEPLDYISTTALSLAGGSIRNLSSFDADLTLPAPGTFGSLSQTSGIVIDTTDPVISESNITFSGATGDDGSFRIGDVVTVEWNPVSGDGDTHLDGSMGSVTFDLSQFGGLANATAIYANGSWIASFLIPAGVSVNGPGVYAGITATDAAGNQTTLTTTQPVALDAIAPAVTAVDIGITGATGLGGAYRIGDTITATLTDTNPDTAEVTFDFRAFGGNAAEPATLQGGVWTASHTIVAGAIDATNVDVGVTLRDLAGNTTTQSDDTGATIDNMPPVLTATSIFPSGATGNPASSVFKIGDTVFVDWNTGQGGDTNTDTLHAVTVDFSDFGGLRDAPASPSNGIWSATYTLPEGNLAGTAYRVSVTVTDDAGNEVTVQDDLPLAADTFPTPTPSDPLLAEASNSGSLADTITNTTRPAIFGTAEPNASVLVHVNGSFLTVTPADGAGDWTFVPFLDLPEGDTTFTVTAVDYVGNLSGMTAPLVVTVDTTAPAAPSTAILDSGSDSGLPTDQLTSVTDPLLSGTAEPLGTVQVMVDNNPVGIAPVDVSGNWSLRIPSVLAEGANAITVTVTDVAGNTSAPSAPLLVTLDTLSPAIGFDGPLMGDDIFGAAEAASVTISGRAFRVEDGQTVALTVRDDTTRLSFTTTVTGGMWSTTVDLSTLTDGLLTLEADLSDLAGNPALPGLAQITKDTVAVIAFDPVLMGDNLFGGPEAATVMLSGTTTHVEDGQTVTVSASDGTTTLPFTATVAGGAWSLLADLSTLADGPLTITADVTDIAGNPAAQATHVIAKDIVTAIAFDDPLMGDNLFAASEMATVMLSGTTTHVDDGQTVTVTIGDSADTVTATTTVAGDRWSLSVDLSTLADGPLALTADVTDIAGNPAVQARHIITKDTVTAIAIDTPLMGDNLFGAAEAGAVTLSGSTVHVDDGQTVFLTVTDGTTTLPFTTAVTGDLWSVTVDLSTLADGPLTIAADVTDIAGNPAAQARHILTKDIVSALAIDVPLMGDNLFGAAEAAAVTLSGSTTHVEDGQTVILSVSDGTTTLPFAATVTGGLWSTIADLSALADGHVTLTAEVTDLAGNPTGTAVQTLSKDIVSPAVTVTGPTEIVTAAFDVTVTFAEPVTGFDLADVVVAEGTATALTGDGDTYAVTIDPVLGRTVQVHIPAGAAIDEAGNPTALSPTYAVQAGSPASAFAAAEEDIRTVLQEQAETALRATLSATRRFMSGTRDRFIAVQRDRARCATGDDAAAAEGCDPTRTDIPFDIDGGVEAGAGTLSAQGTFYGQSGDPLTGTRRLVWGDVEMRHDSGTDSTTATLTGRLAWERLVGPDMLMGWMIGGDLAQSGISGRFEGDHIRTGLSLGGYGVRQLGENLYLDAFLTFGAGLNNLTMADDVLTLESDYFTRSAAFGAALTGVIARPGYEIRPELALGLGRTWIGEVTFTGDAYGLTDDDLVLDAGSVTLADVTFRPEVRFALDAAELADALSVLTIAPRVLCERLDTGTLTENCGTGLDIGVTSLSPDGLTRLDAQITADVVGDRSTTGLVIALEHRF